MENNYYQIYIDSIFELVTSIVIKSSDTADMLNNQLLVERGPGSVNTLDPTTWRYYLNVSGQYHIVDTMMKVISLDTLELINFTKSNLSVHLATAKAYQYGTRSYKELLNQYPTQERLILGILYPVNIQNAINAADGTILSYPPTLVEEHEYSFISNLQTWINGFLIRWNNSQFKLSDNLYLASMYGVMFINMAMAILNIRLRACKSNEAHSYHIRQYLASNGMLDSYIDFLTRKQILFLYRNIRHITRNSGKTETFKWLLEHIMTQRDLPLAEYQMRHDLTNQPTELYPTLSFYKRPLNTEANVDQKNIFTVNEILNKEDSLSRDNLKYREFYQNRVISLMKNSLSNKEKTKLLESTTIDYAGSERYTLIDTLFNNWAYLSHIGLYNTYINITTPSSGEIISIQANNAYELYIYAFCKTLGITLVHLPTVVAERVIPTPKPTLSTIMSVVDSKLVDPVFGQKMLSLLPTQYQLVSTDAFHQWCQDFQQVQMKQYYFVCAEQNSLPRAQKQSLVNKCYADITFQLGTVNQTYSNWFNQHNLDISQYSADDLNALTVEIFNKALGLDTTNRVTLADIQSAMVRLMAQLGSYTVQYSSIINQNPIKDAPNATVRFDVLGSTVNSDEYSTLIVEVIDHKALIKHSLDFDIGHKTLELDLNVELKQSIDLKINVKPDQNEDAITTYFIRDVIEVKVDANYTSVADNPRKIIPVIGIDNYLNLSAAEQKLLPDAWFA